MLNFWEINHSGDTWGEDVKTSEPVFFFEAGTWEGYAVCSEDIASYRESSDGF